MKRKTCYPNSHFRRKIQKKTGGGMTPFQLKTTEQDQRYKRGAKQWFTGNPRYKREGQRNPQRNSCWWSFLRPVLMRANCCSDPMMSLYFMLSHSSFYYYIILKLELWLWCISLDQDHNIQIQGSVFLLRGEHFSIQLSLTAICQITSKISAIITEICWMNNFQLTFFN